MNVLGIDRVLLSVGTLDAAVAYYSGRLGLPLRRRLDAAGIAVFAVGAETPGIAVQAGAEAGVNRCGHRVWLEVADARAAGRELQSRGLSLLGPPSQTAVGWVVEVTDPWGNIVGFADYATRPDLSRRGPWRATAPTAADPEHTRVPDIPEALLAEALETLSHREQEILRYRFGLKDGQAHTLEETGHAFRVTRERVRQIETKLIRQLQQPE